MMTTLWLILNLSFSYAAISPSAKTSVDCVTNAKTHILEFGSPVQSHADAVKLCRGARSNQPYDCARQVQAELSAQLSSADAINLCAGAISNAPFECAKTAAKNLGMAGSIFLTSADVISLCRGSLDQTPLSCVEEMKGELNNRNVASPVQTNSDLIDLCAPKSVTL